MSSEQFAQHGPKIRRNGEIAALEHLLLLKPRPLAVDLAALHRATEHHHQTAVPVIGAARAVLFHCAAELGHSHNHHVFHPVTEVLAEGRDRIGKLIQQIWKLIVFVSDGDPSHRLRQRLPQHPHRT